MIISYIITDILYNISISYKTAAVKMQWMILTDRKEGCFGKKWDSPIQREIAAFGTVPIFPYDGYEVLLVAELSQKRSQAPMQKAPDPF